MAPKVHSAMSERHDDGLALYLRRIARTDLLTPAQEKALARRVERGDLAAKDHLIEANLRLVVHIAKRYQREALDPPGDRPRAGRQGPDRAASDPGRRPRPQARDRRAHAGRAARRDAEPGGAGGRARMGGRGGRAP